MSGITIALLLSIIGLISTASSPVVFWSHGAALTNQPIILAGRTLSPVEAFDEYIQSNAQSSIVLFLQDQLSQDDFVKFPSSFPGIRQLTSSISLPSVRTDGESESLKDLLQTKFQGHSVEVGAADLNNWKYSSSGSQQELIVIHLTPVEGKTRAERASILKANAETRQRIIASLADTIGQFSVVVTGNKPSIQIAEKIEDSDLVGRHLLATEAEPSQPYPLFNVADCLYMDASSIAIDISNKSLDLTTNTTWKVDNASSNCSKLVADITSGLPDKFSKFQLTVTFANASGKAWGCSNVLARYTRTGQAESSLSFNCSAGDALEHGMGAPSGSSYACYKTILHNGNNTITFKGLQAQPMAKKGAWGGVYDCVGFFTLPMLTGIFVAVLLATGLLVGITAMMSIQTPRAFDDPKGPMISVPTTE